MLLKRELARAHASLRLEEQRNRGLPPLPAISSAEEYPAARQRGGHEVHGVSSRRRSILPVQRYMDPALRAQIGDFVPEETRNFFAIATITSR